MTNFTTDRRSFLATLTAGIAMAGTTTAQAAPPPAGSIMVGGKARIAGFDPWIATPDGSMAQPATGLSVTNAPGTEPDCFVVGIDAAQPLRIAADQGIALRCTAMPLFEQGVQLWRYEPWRAWTKPMTVKAIADLQAQEVQFFYWRETDGLYGVAVPLSGQGFRTTLGQQGGGLAARAIAGVAHGLTGTLPMLALAYGTEPHAVIAAAYRTALAAMGRTNNDAAKKPYPQALDYLGWNTWNASNLGKDMTEALVLSAVKTLHASKVPVGWVVLDDGYFDHGDQRLRSFLPDPVRFPSGFPALIARLKQDFGIRDVGAWLALDGYWHGIDPDSDLGRAYKDRLFTWTERRDRADAASPVRTNAFLRPDGPDMALYYDAHLKALKDQGVDFLKVDNQLVVERMAAGNFPVWTLGTAMHEGLNAAAARHFDNAVINCMDMTADAYFNFGDTPVARAVEDYFPYHIGETYDLEKGNAAAHVLQALYNTLYFKQMVVPDFDMFESTNPNAKLHAVARAASNGPIYVTDTPGAHDIALLRSLTLEDGRTLRADAALTPTTDCLFQLQAAKPFKAFSHVGDAGLLAIFNLADADSVAGQFMGRDVPGFDAGPLVAYEHLGGTMRRMRPGEAVPVTLPRFGTALWSLHKATGGFACFGRSDKINGLAAISGVTRETAGEIVITLPEMGPIAAWCARKPKGVTVDGKDVPFTYARGLLRIDIPVTPQAGRIIIIRS